MAARDQSNPSDTNSSQEQGLGRDKMNAMLDLAVAAGNQVESDEPELHNPNRQQADDTASPSNDDQRGEKPGATGTDQSDRADQASDTSRDSDG